MKRIKIFISSVQSEFAQEREMLCQYIRTDALLGKFFEPFIFEDVPANEYPANHVYLREVELCDIYLGLFGNLYGYEDIEGVSPTEREYDLATTLHKSRLIYIKAINENERHPKETALIRKVEQDIVRKTFVDIEGLRTSVYASLIRYLEEKEYIRWRPFDASNDNGATLADLDEDKMRNFIYMAQCHDYGLKTPEFHQEEDFRVVIWRNEIPNLATDAPNLATDAPNLATETQNLATENKPIIDELVAKKVKAKMTSQQLIDCIVEVCIVEHSVEELSNLLHKSAAYLRNEVIPNLVDEEILIPTKPRHTRGQTYITSPKYRKQ